MKLFSKLISVLLWLTIFIVILIKKDFIINYSNDLNLNIKYLISLIVFFHVLFSILILPCGAMSVLYGVTLGIYNGLICSVLISLISTSLTFYLAQKKITPFKFYNLDKLESFLKIKIVANEKNIILLSYMNPLFPASSLGYIFGILNIKFTNFLFLSLIGLIPLNLIMVALGNAFR